jgi:hypothetical protein
LRIRSSRIFYYDPSIWLKVTPLSSTASVLRDGKISRSLFNKMYFATHINLVNLATRLLILGMWVVLKISVASMTSTDLITSLAWMISTAFLTSENQKQSGTSAASITYTASTTSAASMTSSDSFHQKNYWAWFFHQSWHQNDLFWSLSVEWIIKSALFYWFLAPFPLEAVEDRDVIF